MRARSPQSKRRADARSAGVRPDRLTAADRAVLWPEDFGWPQHLGVLAVLDGTRLLDSTGRLRVDAVRAGLKRRLCLLPRRFRRILVRPPRWLGGPYWVDAGTVDITRHVREHALADGDEDTLLRACDELRRRAFDPARPRWELWFLTGLPDARVGLFLRAHHTLVDGVSGIAALGTFADGAASTDAAPTGGVGRPPRPAPAPTTVDLVADVVRRRIDGLRHLPFRLARLPSGAARIARVREIWRRTLGNGAAPATSLHRPVGPHRRLVIVRGDLAWYRRVAHAHGATVNDVLLAVVAGGLRDLLTSRGEPVDDLVLHANVPVSLHDREGGRAEGNETAGMIVPLLIGEPDPVRRLRRIAADTAERKREGRLSIDMSGPLGSRTVQRLALRLATRQRRIHVYVTNVPGPPTEVSVAGAPVLEAFPIVPLMGNLTVAVGALSYAGRFDLTIVADYEGCPDVAVLAAGVRRSMSGLAGTGAPGAPPAVPTPVASDVRAG